MNIHDAHMIYDKNSTNYPQHDYLMQVVVGDGITNLDVAMQRLLFALGFKSKLVGTMYLKEAIKLWYNLPQTARVVMTTDIYPRIAEKLNASSDRVERAIRNSIKDCHTNGKLIDFNDLLQSDVVSIKYPPTNGEFLSSIVSWLHIQSQQSETVTVAQ